MRLWAVTSELSGKGRLKHNCHLVFGTASDSKHSKAVKSFGDPPAVVFALKTWRRATPTPLVS